MAGTSNPLPLICQKSITRSYNPEHAVTRSVWAVPTSLATTKGITFVFFSYGY